MNYKAFFAEVADWIEQCNEMAVKNGIDSLAFWSWVMTSAGDLTEKYKNDSLVTKQMLMLIDWLDDFQEAAKEESR